METSSNITKSNPLEDLMASCASITDRALSCRTLPSQRFGSSDTSIKSLIREEQDVTRWMDRMILDYQARLHKPTRTAASRSTYTLQRRLLDESMRIQQEHTLLSRILSSKTARETSFPTNSNEITQLRQQAVQSRNSQVTLALSRSRMLDDLRQRVREASAECRELQLTNRQGFQTMQIDTGNASVPSSGAIPTSTRRLADENLLLSRALADLLVGSQLDWHADARLGMILQQLDN